MTEPEAPPPPESVTAWHPMLVALLEIYLPSGWQLIPELCLMVVCDRITPGFVEQIRRLQFRKRRGATTMKDYELAQLSLKELLMPTLERMAEEEPEKLAKMIPPEQRIAGLTPEQRLAGLPPEQRLAGLTPEQLAQMVDALPPDVREQIKRRLH